jgi:hypothetical protein
MAGLVVGFERFLEVSQRRQRMAAEFAQLAAEAEAESRAEAVASGEPIDQAVDAGCETSPETNPEPPRKPAPSKGGTTPPIAGSARSRRNRDAV